ncbi:hypothetical protein [Clostridium aminobutyricum]|uniref:Uncharacterized protein n=1 Tax=Clostridium aminobutyricum TaxID=33953 RepID=A0A939D6I6_CLOAM|nr:hypothetical protein [Clostridium aminobutyricum]MBN7771981.1 hypothetical protein [Clostridium aminobutyricum]
MDIQIELNIISDTDLKNQWDNEISFNIELSKNSYRVCEVIFKYNDLLAGTDLENIMEKSYQFIKEKYNDKTKSFKFYRIMQINDGVLYCYIVAENYKQLKKVIRKSYKTILNYQTYLKYHYLKFMESHKTAINNIYLIEPQKILKKEEHRLLYNVISILISLGIFRIYDKLIFLILSCLIIIGIFIYLDRLGGIKRA